MLAESIPASVFGRPWGRAWALIVVEVPAEEGPKYWWWKRDEIEIRR